MVLLLKPFLSSAQLVPALVVYRAIYYLLPLATALVVLVVDELRQPRGQAARASAFLGWLSEEITPRVLAVIDRVIVSSLADSPVFVVRAGRTTRRSLVRAVEEIRRSKAGIIGVVFNEVRIGRQGIGTPFYHYYQYEYETEGRPSAPSAPDAKP